MLTDHRRAIWLSVGLLAAMVFMFVAVGRHPEDAAPTTTIAFIGEWDLLMYEAMIDIRNDPLTAIALVLNVLGGGLVTIPLRSLVAIWLGLQRRWRAFASWVLTWAAAEVITAGAKSFFHRGRPPESIVDTVGYSFPSGHAVAGAATAVALVLVLLPPGRERRRWEVTAVVFAFVMALSRVYLRAHWLSDVAAGVLLGAGVALGCAGLVTEVRDLFMRRRSPAEHPTSVTAPP
ncbi:MAG TPA: phosphatase PAP2 family protein [Actinomycetota bacterium]|nr:phosphatase PAP2 family protein [Actinomycetota bacterium]